MPRPRWYVLACLMFLPWLAAWPVGADEPAPALAEVQQVIAAMEKAVVAADVEGYLRLVSAGDSFFRQEQACWADDLKKIKPETFEIKWDNPSVSADGQRVTGEMTWVWRLPKARSDRKVPFPASFVREDGQWKFAGEVWLHVDSDRCRVLFLDEKLRKEAEGIAEVFPEIRRQVFADFEEKEPAMMQVKIYPRMQHLQASIFLSYVDGIAGWNEPGEAIKLLSMRQGGAGKTIRATLAHELGHAATWQMGPKSKNVPWWVQEGVAEQVSEFYTNKRRASANTVAALIKSKQLSPWDKIHDFTPESLKLSLQVYNQGHHMCAWLTDRFGKKKRNEWLRAMAAGQSLEDACKSVFGTPFSELAGQWQKVVEENPQIIIKPEAPTPTATTPKD